MYNNVPNTLLQGTLGEAGDYPPTVGISMEDGLALVASGGEATLNVVVTNITTYAFSEASEDEYSDFPPRYNVIAQTKAGDAENVLMVGAHTDSVQAGMSISLLLT